MQQAQFTYSPLGKAFEKQTEKQADALTSQNLSNKTNEFKEMEGIFSKYLLNNLTTFKLKEII